MDNIITFIIVLICISILIYDVCKNKRENMSIYSEDLNGERDNNIDNPYCQYYKTTDTQIGKSIFGNNRGNIGNLIYHKIGNGDGYLNRIQTQYTSEDTTDKNVTSESSFNVSFTSCNYDDSTETYAATNYKTFDEILNSSWINIGSANGGFVKTIIFQKNEEVDGEMRIISTIGNKYRYVSGSSKMFYTEWALAGSKEKHRGLSALIGHDISCPAGYYITALGTEMKKRKGNRYVRFYYTCMSFDKDDILNPDEEVSEENKIVSEENTTISNLAEANTSNDKEESEMTEEEKVADINEYVSNIMSKIQDNLYRIQLYLGLLDAKKNIYITESGNDNSLILRKYISAISQLETTSDYLFNEKYGSKTVDEKDTLYKEYQVLRLNMEKKSYGTSYSDLSTAADTKISEVSNSNSISNKTGISDKEWYIYIGGAGGVVVFLLILYIIFLKPV